MFPPYLLARCFPLFLFDTCIFDTVHQIQLARAVSDARRMTPEALRLFTEDGPDEVVLPECSQLAPAALAEALVPCATPRCVLRFSIRAAGMPTCSAGDMFASNSVEVLAATPIGYQLGMIYSYYTDVRPCM